MKSIQNQYIDLKEGKMSQANFMRNVRMTLPQYVTNVTSFKDAVRILKNKAILNEAIGVDPIEATLKSYLAKGYSYAEAIEATAAEQGMDEEVLMSQYPQDAVDTEGYEDEEDAEFADMIARAEEEEAGKYTKFQDFPGGISEGRKKKEPKAELHPNQIHPQELRMGIKVEMEHTDELDVAKKIALDHLAENPFYYTALKLAGVESPSAPKVNPPAEKKAKKKKEAVELVDKTNAMQKVKMPKVVKENLSKFKGEYTFNGTLTKDEMKELDRILSYKGEYEVEVDEVDDHYETTIYHTFYNELNLKDAVKQARGQSSPSKDKLDLGSSFDKFKSNLESLVREVLAEMESNEQEADDIALGIDETYDGRDDLDA